MHTAIITITIHHDGLLSAQEIIDLATADIQARNPPVVHLSHGWILSLNISYETELYHNNTSLSLSVLISTIVCTIIALCLLFVITYFIMKYKR